MMGCPTLRGLGWREIMLRERRRARRRWVLSIAAVAAVAVLPLLAFISWVGA